MVTALVVLLRLIGLITRGHRAVALQWLRRQWTRRSARVRPGRARTDAAIRALVSNGDWLADQRR